MENPLKDQMVSILSRCSDMAISTIRSDGYPQTTVVSYVNEGDRVYFGCWAQSQKAANIALSDKVSYAVHTAVRDWDKIEAVQGSGHAIRVTEPNELTRFVNLMIGKFPQIEKFMKGDPMDMAVFRIDPVAVSVLDYSKGFGHSANLPLPAVA